MSVLSRETGGEARQDRDRQTALSMPRSQVFAPVVSPRTLLQGRLPEIKRQVIEMSLNGSGVRDTARILQISTATVIQELKKKDRPSRR